jgi:hypothetical protein
MGMINRHVGGHGSETPHPIDMMMIISITKKAALGIASYNLTEVD